MLHKFLTTVGNPGDIRDSIEHSARRRGFGESTTNFVKLHTVKEVGEVITASSDDNFFEELSDVIIISISGDRMGHWWCGDSPYPVPDNKEEFMLLLAKTAGTIVRVNSLPHLILQWADQTNNTHKLVKAFRAKVEYNSVRED